MLPLRRVLVPPVFHRWRFRRKHKPVWPDRNYRDAREDFRRHRAQRRARADTRSAVLLVTRPERRSWMLFQNDLSAAGARGLAASVVAVRDLWQYCYRRGEERGSHLVFSPCLRLARSFIQILCAKASPFSCVHFHVNHATKSERQIETITSERWCAPTMMLDHPMSEASAIAPMPSQGRA